MSTRKEITSLFAASREERYAREGAKNAKGSVWKITRKEILSLFAASRLRVRKDMHAKTQRREGISMKNHTQRNLIIFRGLATSRETYTSNGKSHVKARRTRGGTSTFSYEHLLNEVKQ
jgi:hypothetical protein